MPGARPPASELFTHPTMKGGKSVAASHNPPRQTLVQSVSPERPRPCSQVPLETHSGGQPPGPLLAQLLPSPTASSPRLSFGELYQQESCPAFLSPGQRAGRCEGWGWKMVAGGGRRPPEALQLGRRRLACPWKQHLASCPAQVFRCIRPAVKEAVGSQNTCPCKVVPLSLSPAGELSLPPCPSPTLRASAGRAVGRDLVPLERGGSLSKITPEWGIASFRGVMRGHNPTAG